MPAFTVCRIKKLKSPSLRSVGDHNMRLIDVPQRNEGGKFFRLVGSNKKHTSELVKEHINKHVSGKVRKDAVVAVEMVLSVSPEYFRPKNPSAWGNYEGNKVQDWYKETLNFLGDKYKGNLVEATLHLDEATPHLHVIIVPLVASTKSRRRTKEQIQKNIEPEKYHSISLNAKDMFDRTELSLLQTEYAESVSSLGIQRGLKGSRAKNVPLKKFYSEMNEALSIKPVFDKPVIESPPAILGKAAWLLEENKKVSMAFEAQQKELNRLNRLVKNYENRSKNEKLRVEKVMGKFGSVEDVERKFDSMQSHISDLKDKLVNANESHGLEVKSLKSEIGGLKDKVKEIAGHNEILRRSNFSLRDKYEDNENGYSR